MHGIGIDVANVHSTPLRREVTVISDTTFGASTSASTSRPSGVCEPASRVARL
jgi:hypothetical protein